MDDRELTARISELVAEEHRLERAHAGRPLTDEEQARIDALAVELDRCWDLLRQRRARRASGEDPDEARPRSGETVEHYRQ